MQNQSEVIHHMCTLTTLSDQVLCQPLELQNSVSKHKIHNYKNKNLNYHFEKYIFILGFVVRVCHF